MKWFRPSSVEEAVAAWEEETWGSLTRSDRVEMRKLHATGRYTQRELSRRFKVATATVRRALRKVE